MIYSTVADNTGRPAGASTWVVTSPRTAPWLRLPVPATALIDGATISTYSYDDDGTCGFADATDVSNGSDPLLGVLVDNGGATLTAPPR